MAPAAPPCLAPGRCYLDDVFSVFAREIAMFEKMTCVQGHHWEREEGGPPESGRDCPVCGGEPIPFTLDPLRKQFVLGGGFLKYLNGKIADVRAWEAAR